MNVALCQWNFIYTNKWCTGFVPWGPGLLTIEPEGHTHMTTIGHLTLGLFCWIKGGELQVALDVSLRQDPGEDSRGSLCGPSSDS